MSSLYEYCIEKKLSTILIAILWWQLTDFYLVSKTTYSDYFIDPDYLITSTASWIESLQQYSDIYMVLWKCN